MEKNGKYYAPLYAKRYNNQNIEQVSLKPIGGNNIMFKYGASDNFIRRTYEHSTGYGPQIKIIYMIGISSNFIFAAEQNIKKYFMDNGCHMQVPGHNELAIVNMNDIEKNEEIKNKFKEINDMYGKKSNFDTSKRHLL